MHKESPNLRRIGLGVEKRLIPSRPTVSTEQSLTPAPSSAGHDSNLTSDCVRFNRKVRAIRDQLRIRAEVRSQRAIYLLRRIVSCLQLSNRQLDQSVQIRNIRDNRRTVSQVGQRRSHRFRISAESTLNYNASNSGFDIIVDFDAQ
jgi:hypothetical protein